MNICDIYVWNVPIISRAWHGGFTSIRSETNMQIFIIRQTSSHPDIWLDGRKLPHAACLNEPTSNKCKVCSGQTWQTHKSAFSSVRFHNFRSVGGILNWQSLNAFHQMAHEYDLLVLFSGRQHFAVDCAMWACWAKANQGQIYEDNNESYACFNYSHSAVFEVCFYSQEIICRLSFFSPEQISTDRISFFFRL